MGFVTQISILRIHVLLCKVTDFMRIFKKVAFKKITPELRLERIRKHYLVGLAIVKLQIQKRLISIIRDTPLVDQ